MLITLSLPRRPRLFVGMILILIFAEVLGLYGLIVALVSGSTSWLDIVNYLLTRSLASQILNTRSSENPGC